MLLQFQKRNKTRSPDRNVFLACQPEELLLPHQAVVAAIQSLVAAPPSHWNRLYLPALTNLAGLLQHLPASEAYHHSEPGGALRHSLEVALEALRRRRTLLLPQGAPAETVSSQADLWTYAITTAALLHDIGKPLTDMRILLGPPGRSSNEWSPLDGPLEPGTRYSWQFRRDRIHQRHTAVTAVLASYVIPRAGLRWLSTSPLLFVEWLAALNEAGSNLIARIVKEADMRSTASDLGSPANPPKRARSLAERLVASLRDLLLSGDLPLNKPGACGFVTEDDLWLVAKRALDAIRERLRAAGAGGVPTRNDRLMDELQQHGWLTPNGDRAVWRCEIQIGDWCQTLSCLRMPVDLVWSESSERPPLLPGSVRPVGEDPPAADAEAAQVSDTTPRIAPSDPGADQETQQASDDEDKYPEQCTNTPASTPLPLPPTGHDEAGAEGSSSAKDPGERFLSWLRSGIQERRLAINTPQARLHVVHEGLALISPGIFRDFAPLEWYRVQKRFQKLKVHKKTPWDENIWTCRVEKDRKRSSLKVFLIPDPQRILDLADPLPPPNPTVTLLSRRGESELDTYREEDK